MPKPVFLLSDLHLPSGASPLREAFRALLARAAGEASAVYILGDLFEYWVGDDDGLRAYDAEIQALRALTKSGVPVYFQHGNRDFLLGREFSRRTGVQLLPETLTLSLAGEKVLLAHGDQYCTLDRAYQRWRIFSRNRFIQFLFACLPLAWRKRIGGDVRSRSSAQKSANAMEIMDVTETAINSAFLESDVDRIIHGHTHRPADHRLELSGRPRTRTVLADWRPGHCEFLRADAAGFTRVAWSPSSSA